MNLSPGRRAWLERLRDEGQAKRGRGQIGFSCMQAGWAEWLWVGPAGEQLGTGAVEALFAEGGPGSWARARDAGWTVTGLETITEAGRLALEKETTMDDAMKAGVDTAGRMSAAIEELLAGDQSEEAQKQAAAVVLGSLVGIFVGMSVNLDRLAAAATKAAEAQERVAKALEAMNEPIEVKAEQG